MAKKKGLVKKIILGCIGTIVLFVLILIANLIITEKSQSVVSEGQPIANYDEHKVALLVIDIQEATTGDISTYPFFKGKSDDLIKDINLIAVNCKEKNIPVIYVRSEIKNPFINFLNNSYAKGSPGAGFDKRLKIVSALEVVKNGEDSFRNTKLDSILTGNRVNELYIVGLDAADCVNATVKAAQNRKYLVGIVEEAVISKSTELTDSMMLDFKSRGVHVFSMDSLIKMQ
jgi:nicotinamidase/pyrazinamidase